MGASSSKSSKNTNEVHAECYEICSDATYYEKSDNVKLKKRRTSLE
jgi:hypothetical protein